MILEESLARLEAKGKITKEKHTKIKASKKFKDAKGTKKNK